MHIKEGVYTSEEIDVASLLRCSVGAAAAVGGRVLLYKRVNKIGEGVYSSLYDKDFLYKDGEVSSVGRDVQVDWDVSCGEGLHCSGVHYWEGGDTLIAMWVDVADILSIAEGKVRAKKVLVIGECQ